MPVKTWVGGSRHLGTLVTRLLLHWLQSIWLQSILIQQPGGNHWVMKILRKRVARRLARCLECELLFGFYLFAECFEFRFKFITLFFHLSNFFT